MSVHLTFDTESHALQSVIVNTNNTHYNTHQHFLLLATFIRCCSAGIISGQNDQLYTKKLVIL